MTIKHRIPCFDSELLVREIGEAAYELAIQSSSNPLGFGNALHVFTRLEDAAAAAERFCRLYTAARGQGYYLKEHTFIKPGREGIDIPALLQAGVEVGELAERLA